MNNTNKNQPRSTQSFTEGNKKSIFFTPCYSVTSVVIFIVVFALSGVISASAQEGETALGDAAIAAQYLLWAENAITEGRWTQARAALERASDFAGVSSDISYLLAQACFHENETRSSVLQLLEKAIKTGRWERYNEAQARLFAAEQLIALRRYSSALETLAAAGVPAGTIDFDLLRLGALYGLINSGIQPDFLTVPVLAEFRRCMRETLELYPRDGRPVRILLKYAQEQPPAADDGPLVELALLRLPFLLDTDPELAWMSAPFLNDLDEARRLVAAYRAGSYHSFPLLLPNPASLVPALNLGLIDDIDAVEELFTQASPGAALVLDKDIIVNVGNLLRSEEGRENLVMRLHSFTGTIVEDEDRDGYAESRAVYQQGGLQEYSCDAAQDRRSSLLIRFNSGSPQWAELTASAVLPQAGQAGASALVFWERYPSVQRAEMGTETFLYAPRDFQYAPVRFIELGASLRYAGLLFPQRNPHYQSVSRFMLASFAIFAQRPSVEFLGGISQVYLKRGIPLRAEDIVNGATVSVTEFENGRPVIRRMDLDLDGRMETIHRFTQTAGTGQAGIASSESDWRGDGAFTTAELYRKDGSVVYSWDLDGSGTRKEQ